MFSKYYEKHDIPPFAKGCKMLFDVKKKCKYVQNKDKTRKRTNKETY
jgi:hypothetical protein